VKKYAHSGPPVVISIYAHPILGLHEGCSRTDRGTARETSVNHQFGRIGTQEAQQTKKPLKKRL